MSEAIVFTDGSANNLTGSGGWAAIVRTPTQLVELSGWAEDTTSNRMELTAAIEGLRYFNLPTKIELAADSSYLLKTLKNGWYNKWLEEKRDPPRPNMDLWQELHGLIHFHDLSFVKIKGHSGDYWNTRADKLAGIARKERKVTHNVTPNFDFAIPTEYPTDFRTETYGTVNS